MVKPTEYKQRETVKNNGTKDYNSNTEIEETKKLFHNLRNNFSREEIKKHREKIYKKEQVYNHLKEIEQKDKKQRKEKFNNERKKSGKKYHQVF